MDTHLVSLVAEIGEMFDDSAGVWVSSAEMPQNCNRYFIVDQSQDNPSPFGHCCEYVGKLGDVRQSIAKMNATKGGCCA